MLRTLQNTIWMRTSGLPMSSEGSMKTSTCVTCGRAVRKRGVRADEAPGTVAVQRCGECPKCCYRTTLAARPHEVAHQEWTADEQAAARTVATYAGEHTGEVLTMLGLTTPDGHRQNLSGRSDEALMNVLGTAGKRMKK